MMKTINAPIRLPFHGYGEVVIENIYDEDCDQDSFMDASISTIKNSYPLKLLVPSNASTSSCKWIYPINFGGGLVGGDHIDMSVHVKRNCCSLLTGQESTKIYHCDDNLQSSQILKGTVEDGALLCALCDPVVCYKDANFKQTQEFRMSAEGNLVYLDWLLGGRIALDELWQFKNFQNKTDIYIDDELVYRDNYNLHNNGLAKVTETMGKQQVIGSCIILGSKLETVTKNLLKSLGKKKDLGEKYDQDLTCSVSPLTYTVKKGTVCGVYIRFMASSSLKAYNGVVSVICSELKHIIGGNPFAEKYCSA